MSRVCFLCVIFFSVANVCLSGPLIGLERKHAIKRQVYEETKKVKKMRQIQMMFEHQIDMKKYLENVSFIMSECGLSKEWQVEYFYLRASRAIRNGSRIMGECYMQHGKKLQQQVYGKKQDVD